MVGKRVGRIMAETNYGLLGGLRELFYNALKVNPDALDSNYQANTLIEAWNREIDDIQKVFDRYEMRKMDKEFQHEGTNIMVGK
jgi:hypothetical protein